MDTFSDLPDALVRDLLNQASPVAEAIQARLEALRTSRAGVRDEALRRGWIRRKADLDVPREPSVAGVDGSYQVHRLTALDLAAAAAVAVEGTAREARRYWEQPHHRMWVRGAEHSKNLVNTLRGLMISMELELAALAPHDIVLLDGSFIVLVIYLNQGLTSVDEAPMVLRAEFLDRWSRVGVLDRLLAVLSSDRVVAVPKYSGRNELAELLPDPDQTVDAKTVATMILEPGEYTAPLPIYDFGTDEREYHLPDRYCPAAARRAMNAHLAAMRAIFFRPFGWAPAIRLEVPQAIATSLNRLSIVLHGLERQFFTPAVIEPYPLFIADRMVKSLGAGVSVVEQAVAQQVAGSTADVETTLLFLQNHRTEGGRGGT